MPIQLVRSGAYSSRAHHYPRRRIPRRCKTHPCGEPTGPGRARWIDYRSNPDMSEKGRQSRKLTLPFEKAFGRLSRPGSRRRRHDPHH